MNIALDRKNFFIVIFFISLFSIVGALYFEFILKLKPCILCLYQRIPYIILIFICLIGYNYSDNLFWHYLVILIFFISVLISGYHVGIENSLFPELSTCKASNLDLTDKKQLLQSLNNQIASCKDVLFKIFGLSLATINLIISLTVVALGTIYIYHEKN
tara:strand:+ start:1042 stop:1518 length:477 start_codon:yes stop_codon:yes gene_type:complete